jgi:hypothetical protein
MSQTFGLNQGQWQSSIPYNINCNNDFIDTITARSLGSYIRAIGSKCKSGEVHNPFGGPDLTNKFNRYHTRKCDNGFNGMDVVHGYGIHSIAPKCGNENQEPIGKFDIPHGQVIKSISGLADDGKDGYIGTMNIRCGNTTSNEVEHFGNNSFSLFFVILLILFVIVIYLKS